MCLCAEPFDELCCSPGTTGAANDGAVPGPSEAEGHSGRPLFSSSGG